VTFSSKRFLGAIMEQVKCGVYYSVLSSRGRLAVRLMNPTHECCSETF
jgi:hypothetical protein